METSKVLLNATSAFRVLIQACADVHDCRPQAEAAGIVHGWMNLREAVGVVVALTLVENYEPEFSPKIMASVLFKYCDAELLAAFVDFYEQLSGGGGAAARKEMRSQQFDVVMDIAEFAASGRAAGWKSHWSPFKEPYNGQWQKAFASDRVYRIDDLAVEELGEEEEFLAQSLLVAIIGNNKLSTPVYCPEVKSEADAEAMAGKLPMIYIWNEDRRVGSYTVTINGKYIGSVLEKKVPRTDESFVRIRDAVLYQLREIATKNINATCSMLKIMPSIAFAKKS